MIVPLRVKLKGCLWANWSTGTRHDQGEWRLWLPAVVETLVHFVRMTSLRCAKSAVFVVTRGRCTASVGILLKLDRETSA
jgi:hypothetical protein